MFHDFLKTKHKPSFPKSSDFFRILFQNPNLIGKITFLTRFLATYCIKTYEREIQNTLFLDL